MAKLYVGTYHKYNNGSIAGQWLDLTDYVDSESFYEACAVLHSDEVDPEFMFQDFEGFPKSLYSESGNIDAIYEYLDLVDSANIPQEAIDVGIEYGIELDKIEERYFGEFSSDYEFGEHLIEESGLLNNVPETVKDYFDFEQYGKDQAFDFITDGQYYFTN